MLNAIKYINTKAIVIPAAAPDKLLFLTSSSVIKFKIAKKYSKYNLDIIYKTDQKKKKYQIKVQN